MLSKLTALIEKNKAYIVDGSLNRNLLAADARKYDPELLNLLQEDKELKEHFFSSTDGGLVFKKDVFLQFIMNKEFLPDSYTKYKIKIGLGAEDGSLLSESGDVVLNWPYKDAILEGGQDKEDQKRSEVFFNEVLAPDQITRLLDDKVFTNWKRYDKDGEHDLDELKDDDNLIIKGNNLVVLHSLEKRYAGKVKLIYIDPPYNTGGDSFRYNDSFNKATWLTFMKNRLEVAKRLLSDEGVIYISIDHHENHTLKLLMDEIFGRTNSIQDIVVETSSPAGFKLVNPGPVKVTETVLVYAKNKPRYINGEKKLFVEDKWPTNYDKYVINPDDEVDQWKIAPLSELIYRQLDVNSQKELKAKFGQSTDVVYSATASAVALQNSKAVFTTYKPHNPAPQMKKAIEESKAADRPVELRKDDGSRHILLKGRLMAFYQSKLKKIDERDPVPTRHLTNLWTDLSWSGISSEGGNMLNNGKKPEKLLERIINLSTNPGDLVLDYHLGSGTTAAVAHKMGRQYIGIEQMYYGDDDPTKRLHNVINGDQSGISKVVHWQGGGSFVYANIMNNSNKFRKRVEAAKNDTDYLQLLNEATSSSFLSYRVDPKRLNEEEFRKLSSAEKRRLLLELIDNNTLYVNYEDINDPIFKVSEKDKEFNKKLYEKN
ncbi:MAG: site-specific DNA-methyltransferase [Clostridia bacterium]|nr:site-specific DNA-methyltransferase [Clostridia bacterium]